MLRVIPLLAAVAGCVPVHARDPVGCSLRLEVTPRVIEMGMFYKGADVHVRGTVAAGSKVAVVVSGEQSSEVFNRKVKMGPIWINSGKIRIAGVPSLFLRFTDGMLRDSMAREDIDRYHIDQAAIQRQMEVVPDEDHEMMVASWLSLKAQDSKYALVRDGVKMGKPQGGLVPFSVRFDWPRKAPAGDYKVSAFEYRNRHVVATQEVPLRVERVGFAAWMADVVKQKALLYGIIAVVVAGLTGFGIDFLVALIFGKKAVAAH